jgi:hypothetical protein
MQEKGLQFPTIDPQGIKRIAGQKLPIKTMLDLGINNHLKWKLKSAFSLFGQPSIRCGCDGKPRINQTHILQCHIFD